MKSSSQWFWYNHRFVRILTYIEEWEEKKILMNAKSLEWIRSIELAYTFVHAVHVIKWLFLLSGSNNILHKS